MQGRARLTILTAIPRPPAWVATPMTAAACEPLAREFEREAVATLRAARDAVPAEVPVTTILTRKPVREAVLARLGAHPHDLVVVGSSPRGALREAVRCSTCRYLQQRSPVPVLVVHPPVPAPRAERAPARPSRSAPPRPARAVPTTT